MTARSDRAPESAGLLVKGGREADLAAALHEVSNGLTVVLGWIERAREASEKSLPDEVRAAIDVALARTRHAHRVARSAVGAAVPEDCARPLSEIATDALLGLEPEAQKRLVSLSSRVDSKVQAAALQSPTSLLQVLTNLLLNALAWSRERGSVVLEARYLGRGEVTFSVLDDGPGIPPGRENDLFQAGFSARTGGAGIGLKHAADLAGDVGGRLSYAGPAHAGASPGARFDVTWPISIPTFARPSQMPAVSIAGSRILILEDDAAVIDLLEIALSARGATVVSVQTADELHLVLEREVFDAILLDFSPIEAKLNESLDVLHRLSPSTRLVMISGSGSAPPPSAITDRAAWVRKPFEIGDIVEAIVRVPGRIQ